MDIKIHQYKDTFMSELRFYMEIKDGDTYNLSYTFQQKLNRLKSTESNLPTDEDRNVQFYFNKDLNED